MILTRRWNSQLVRNTWRHLSTVAATETTTTTHQLPVREHYDHLVETGVIRKDRSQLRVVRAFQRLEDTLVGYEAPSVSLIQRQLQAERQQAAAPATSGLYKPVNDLFKMSLSFMGSGVAHSMKAAKSIIPGAAGGSAESPASGEELALTSLQLLGRPDLVAVDGVLYDLDAFGSKHPGGAIIMSTAGTDATAVFYEMHPDFMIKRAKRRLEKYRVGRLLDSGDGEKAKKAEALDLFPRGLYVYGGSGSGKTFMMDMFFHSLNIGPKRRVHFHQFMIETHRKLHQLKSAGLGANMFLQCADEIREQTHVLCLDEFMVTDVADAMIMKQLFDALWQAGVVVVITSNRAPEELYKNGMQRHLFLPFIEELQSRCKTIRVNSDTDYRMLRIQELEQQLKNCDGSQEKFLIPRPAESAHNPFFENLWLDATEDGDVDDFVPLDVHGRIVSIPFVEPGNAVARIGFNQLCGDVEQPMGVADYLAIASTYNAVFVQDVPIMKISDVDTVRRFISFVDVLYDRHVLLVLDAEAGIDGLFDEEGIQDEHHAAQVLKRGGDIMGDEYLAQTVHDLDQPGDVEYHQTGSEESVDEVFAIARARSRLHEMQGNQYAMQSKAKALLPKLEAVAT